MHVCTWVCGNAALGALAFRPYVNRDMTFGDIDADEAIRLGLAVHHGRPATAGWPAIRRVALHCGLVPRRLFGLIETNRPAPPAL